MNERKEYPKLWQRNSKNIGIEKRSSTKDNGVNLTLQQLLIKSSSKPKIVPWIEIWKSSLVVGQEYVLVCFYLSRHRMAQYSEQHNSRMLLLEEESPLSQLISFVAVFTSFFLIIWFSRESSSSSFWSGGRYHKAQTRLVDMILMGAVLRLLAAALKTLTASYSSNTVHALSFVGMTIHLWGCDYSYANGITKKVMPLSSNRIPVVSNGSKKKESELSSYRSNKKRDPFLGGTTSLNAAFFSTTLLVSRLNSNWTVHTFVSASLSMFAFYPPRRHQLYITSPKIAPYVTLISILLFCVANWFLLRDNTEKFAYLTILFGICFLAPSWKFYLQTYKLHIHGQWDIAHIR